MCWHKENVSNLLVMTCTCSAPNVLFLFLSFIFVFIRFLFLSELNLFCINLYLKEKKLKTNCVSTIISTQIIEQTSYDGIRIY